MKKLKLIPGHYYIKLKGRKDSVLAFYSGGGIAPWTAPGIWTTWSGVEAVLG